MSDEELLSLLRDIDPFKFEGIIGEIWENMGYSADVRQETQDRGIDIIAKKSDPFERKQLIQVKRYSGENNIGSQKVREYSTLYQQEPNVDTVIIITTGYFTKQATQLADDLNVEILNGEELISEFGTYFNTLKKNIKKKKKEKRRNQQQEKQKKRQEKQGKNKKQHNGGTEISEPISLEPSGENDGRDEQIWEVEEEFDKKR